MPAILYAHQMKAFAIISLILLPLILIGRTWTDTKGRTFEGDLISFDGQQATIERKTDKRIFHVDIQTLSNADRAYLTGQNYEDPLQPEKILGLAAASVALIYSMSFVGKRMNLMNWGIGRSLILFVINAAMFIGFAFAYSILHVFADFPTAAMPLGLLLSILGMIIGSASYLGVGLFKTLFFLFISHVLALFAGIIFTVGSALIIEGMNQT